jgi:hypothetical protein
MAVVLEKSKDLSWYISTILRKLKKSITGHEIDGSLLVHSYK